MDIISFLDWLFNTALPWLAPRLLCFGMVLLAFGLCLAAITDWGEDAHARR